MMSIMLPGSYAVLWLVAAAAAPVVHVNVTAEPNSSLEWVKADGVINAPIWATREVVLFPSRFDGVMPYLKEERVLDAEHCAEGAKAMPGCLTVWCYNLVAPPAIGARDYTIRLDLQSDAIDTPEGFVLTWALSNRGPPPRKDAQRMQANSGRWRLTKEGESTRFEYQISADPGGWIPGWIAKSANQHELPHMIESIQKAALDLAQKKEAAPKQAL